MRCPLVVVLAAVGLGAFVSSANAAPVIRQGYEAADLADPFNLAPDFSGSSIGIDRTVATNNTITLITDDGANGTAHSAELLITDDPAAAGASGSEWTIRLIPNSGGSANANNALFNADGVVGYYLKVAPTVTADILTAPILEGPAGTSEATAGVRKSIIRDGAWHLYQWDMDNAADWNASFGDIFGGTLGNTTLEATNSFDSILFLATTPGNATIRMDEIGFDNAGTVPEPGALSAVVLAALPLASRRRRA